jgi:methionine-rich copper-binding protein CopC
VLVAVSVAVGVALTPLPAAPHASLLRSSPPRRAVLPQAPPRIDLWFSERLEPAYSTVTVESAAGARVDKQDAAVSVDDGHRLSVSLPMLPPGEYVVRFRALSVDGHVVESSFPFTLRPRGAEPR